MGGQSYQRYSSAVLHLPHDKVSQNAWLPDAKSSAPILLTEGDGLVEQLDMDKKVSNPTDNICTMYNMTLCNVRDADTV